MKKEHKGATVERGKIISASSGKYEIESLDRPGIISLPAKPISLETFAVGDIVYMFIHEDGTGRIISSIEQACVPDGSITYDKLETGLVVDDADTDDATKIVSAAVAKALKDAIKAISDDLALRTLASSSYRATSTDYEYVNMSFTVPAGCTYLVQVVVGWNTGAPVGIAIGSSNSELTVSTLVRIYESNSALACRNTPTYMLTAGTYYVWVKRSSIPTSNNNHNVYGSILYKA